MIKPKPTKFFVIDLGRKCNLEHCKFCYYRQMGDLRKQGWEPYEKLLKVIDDGHNRGNTNYELTGAEPSIYPNIVELIKYAYDKYGLKGSMITNALAGENTFQKIIDAGIDEFLVSVHGNENLHDYLIGMEGGFKRQERTLKQIKDNNVTVRFNCVINKFNQNDLLKISKYMASWEPIVCNFINMNLHHQWKDDTHTAKDVISNLNIVENNLNDSITYLESQRIKVNVRYYPFCRIKEEYRRCIANDLQVTFELWDNKLNKDINKEWDYNVNPKTYEKHLEKNKQFSNDNEEKEEPCCNCDIHTICGGINKHFRRVHKEIYGEPCIKIVKPELKNSEDVYYYRRNNV